MMITLYFGDNGIHQFWESEDKQFCFIRNHGERYWQAIRVDGSFSNQGALTAKALAKTLARLTTYDFKFDVASRWLKLYPHHKQMKLVAIPTPTF